MAMKNCHHLTIPTGTDSMVPAAGSAAVGDLLEKSGNERDKVTNDYALGHNSQIMLLQKQPPSKVIPHPHALFAQKPE